MLGVSGAAAGGLSPAWAFPDEWLERLQSGPRLETWKVSTCGQCPGGCGIRVRMIDDIPVRIHGNPIAPVNRGFTCPMGETGLELLYHPDRINQPMVREGEKGGSQWGLLSWDEALQQVAQMLQDVKATNSPQRIGFLLGDRNTLLTQFVSEFVAGIGSPNLFVWRNAGLNELGFWQGCRQFPSPSFDLNHCKYLLTLGVNLLEEPPSPVYFHRLYGEMKTLRPRTGLKMVHVDSRMSQAGVNATEWVPIRPGSMGVLALGMAYVIIRDELHDQEFTASFSQDFRTGDEDFWNLITRDYYPGRVAEVTGIPAETIIRLAREFAAVDAPLALGGGKSDAGENTLFDQWAVACLNAVGGSFSAKDLWRTPAPLPWRPSPLQVFDFNPTPTETRTDDASIGNVPAAGIVERLPEFKERLSDIEILLIAQVDPVYQGIQGKAWAEWLTEIPHVIQFATILDDTSAYADLVLPVSTYLESWDLSLPVPNLPFAQLGLQQPVVSPLTGSRPLGDVLIQLAKQSNLEFPSELNLNTYEDFVRSRMQEILDSGQGTPYFEEISLEWLEELRKRGWQAYSYPTFSEFWDLLREKGGWWEPREYSPIDWDSGRKFAFLTEAGLSRLLQANLSIRGDGMDLPDGASPHLWLERRIKKPETVDSFILIPFLTLFNSTGEGASQFLLQELFGLHQRLYWQTWAEMNPERARELGLEEGDLVRVISERDSFVLPVKVVPSVSPEVLAVPFGQGHHGLGRYARDIGENPLALLDHRTDPLSGWNAWQSTRVRVEPADHREQA